MFVINESGPKAVNNLGLFSENHETKFFTFSWKVFRYEIAIQLMEIYWTVEEYQNGHDKDTSVAERLVPDITLVIAKLSPAQQ